MASLKELVQHTGPLSITYFTDPLCCWSYALEPAWQRLKTELGDALTYQYCMGGMLPDWNGYHDSLNAVTRPLQMGPIWLQAKHISGIFIDDKLWFKDPPASSYPACVAVKAAAQQSPFAEEWLLHALQKAAMGEGRNIAQKQVLLDVAAQTEKDHPGQFNYGLFTKHLLSDTVLEAFKRDLAATAERRITRFPTLLVRLQGSPLAVTLTGYRPYESMVAVLEKLAATTA